MMNNMNRILTLVSVALLGFSVQTFAQTMSDEAIIEYATSGLAAGKSKNQIGQELLSRGVSTTQLQRVMNQYLSGNVSVSTTSSQATKSPKSESFRQRTEFSDESKTILSGKETMDTLQTREAAPIFGQNIFTGKNLTFEPNENAATPETYVLGPGDEVIIDVWGPSEASVRQKISPDGRINVSQVGPIALGGLSIKEARKKVTREFSKFYATNNVSLTLGQIRSIRVNVMGDVVTPGTYRLSSLSTVFTALYRAGGITEIGSLRNVKVVRSGETVAIVDVYKYLCDGDSSCDISLHDGDVVIVPAYGNLVEISGKVKRPMRYEMAEGETLDKLIAYSGGYASDAFCEDARVIRQSLTGQQVFSVASSKAGSFKLADGDFVEVDASQERFANRLEVKGAVKRPGVYQLGDGIKTVGQLVERAGGLMEDAFTGRAQIVREKDDLSLEVIAVALKGIVDGNAPDVLLKNNDVLYIASKTDVEDKGDFTITGYVANPGAYPFADRTTVEDLILLAGGLAEGASAVRVDVSRRIHDAGSMMASDTLAQVFSFAIKDGLMVDGNADFFLEPYDVVVVRRSPGYVEQRNVTITGEVAFPGQYTLVHSGETISEVIKRAGGVTSKAYLQGGLLRRRASEYERTVRKSMTTFARQQGDTLLVRPADVFSVGVEMDKAVQKPGSEYDIVLREGDEIIIPETMSTVGIQGDVLFPNTVSYIPGKGIGYYVNEAGGFGDRARRRKLYVVYMNGNVSSGRNSKVQPGCEIIVPTKRERNPLSVSEIATLGTASASLATIVLTLINLIK